MSTTSVLGDKAQLEELYSRFGWKWTVLAYMAGRVVRSGKQLPGGVVQDMRNTRVKIESGCETLCEMAADLRDLEIKLFPILLDVNEGEVHLMLELLGKAMRGQLQEGDLDLSPLKPVLADCAIPKVCTH